jgi:hypothetical protein
MPRVRLLPSLPLLLIMAAVALPNSWLRAQAPVVITTPYPILLSVSPAAAQTGTQTELSVTGTDLDGATRLHFSVPGVACEPKRDAKQQPVANKFLVTFPAGMAATTCDVRVVAKYGISNPRGFFITPLPVTVVSASATSAENAFAAKLGTVITGASVKQASTYLRFEAKRGQRVLVVCRPFELDSRMDASVSLRNAAGTKLERLRPDGLLDFTSPEDGAYTLEVHDLMFRGDAEYPFVLSLTTGPLFTHVFGGGAQWALYGYNIREVSPAPPDGMMSLRASEDEARRLLAANPVEAVRFGAESDARAAAPVPVALKPPCVHVGWFAPRGKAREFTFEAKKGQAYFIEVNSAGKGLATDPFLTVEKGEAFIGEANDRTAIAVKSEFDHGVLDPSYRFTAKEDGVHRVKLRNLFAQAPQEPFELTLRTAGVSTGEKGDYELVALPSGQPKPKTIAAAEIPGQPMWRGGVAVFKVFALRRNGFDGAIELTAERLPADVKFLGGLIREGQSSGYAAFCAENAAKDWAGPVKLHGNNGEAARGATLLYRVGNATRESILTRLTDEVVLSVTPAEAPVSIEPESAVVEAAADAKLNIPLKVTRRGDFADAVSLISLGVEGMTAAIPAKATEGRLVVDVAKLKLPPGDHPVLLQGVVKFKHQRGDDPKTVKELTHLVHSKPVIIRVKPTEKKA